MKKILVICFFWGLFTLLALSQEGVHVEEGRFVKKMENNMYAGAYNLESKGILEKLFFGDFNAPVEFLFEPDNDREGVSGFRIVKKGSSYVLEIKLVTNYMEVEKDFIEKYSKNRGEWLKLYEEKVKRYKISTRTIPISNQFAEQMHRRMFFCIDDFRVTKIYPPDILPLRFGGYSVTFRTVIDEAVVWSLMIWSPYGNEARKMSDLCRQIITDVRSDNKFDESKYIEELSPKNY